jgi:hypothetical protein
MVKHISLGYSTRRRRRELNLEFYKEYLNVWHCLLSININHMYQKVYRRYMPYKDGLKPPMFHMKYIGEINDGNISLSRGYVESLSNIKYEIFNHLKDIYFQLVNMSQLFCDKIPKKYKPDLQILITLDLLKNATPYKKLAITYKISPTVLWYICTRVIFVFSTSIKHVTWDNCKSKIMIQDYTEDSSITIAGAIDCTSYRRNRVHPGSSGYYRGDKKFHFLTCQTVCDLEGNLCAYSICRGHNNDQIVFLQSKVIEEIVKRDYYLLCDKGYTHNRLLRANDYRILGTGIGRKRAIVENIFGNMLLGRWNFITTKCVSTPEVQAHQIRAVYEITSCLQQKGLMKCDTN